MRERVACEFRLVRYVPDVARGEFTNIGVLLQEASSGRMEVRFARSWARVRSLDPDADAVMLGALETEMQQRLAKIASEERPLLEVLDGSFSNSIQVTMARGYLAESLPAAMDLLMLLYVDRPARAVRASDEGRAAILGRMRRTFEAADTWPLMRKEIAAAEYTAAGDPLRIDCGYRPNGTIRMFQAISLRNDLDGAKVLALAAKDLRAGVQRVEQAALDLIAIVTPLRAAERSEDEVERYQFAVRLMEREEIRVVTTNDLERIGETARRELKV